MQISARSRRMHTHFFGCARCSRRMLPLRRSILPLVKTIVAKGSYLCVPLTKTSLTPTALRTSTTVQIKSRRMPGVTGCSAAIAWIADKCLDAFGCDTGLTFRKLKPLARAGLAGLFPLFHSRIPCQQAFLFQNRPHRSINFE